jgi:Ca-activated chloride channel family protein
MPVTARLITSRIQSQAQQQNLVVTFTAPDLPTGGSVRRPALSLAIVIDRSGSMHGAPIENAKAAALSVIRQLDSRDAFSVVTYSSSAETVIEMQRATEANKAAARAAIETIDDDGGTCISCGLEAGAIQLAARRDQLTEALADRGVRRILLISDGQANEGVYDRNDLAQLAARTSARGVSISTVGVGLDFDEQTMRRLAEVGRGNYYFVEDTVALSQMFVGELAMLSQTVAADVQLIATPGPGVQIEEVYGYPMTRAGDRVVVPIADLRAGESRKVVVRVAIAAAHQGSRVIADVDVGWHQVSDGAQRRSRATAVVDVVDDPAAVAASVDTPTMIAVEQALSARALEDAAAAYEQHGVEGAKQILDRRTHAVRANAARLGARAAGELEAVSSDAIDGFTKAPAQAKKAASVNAYKLAR